MAGGGGGGGRPGGECDRAPKTGEVPWLQRTRVRRAAPIPGRPAAGTGSPPERAARRVSKEVNLVQFLGVGSGARGWAGAGAGGVRESLPCRPPGSLRPDPGRSSATPAIPGQGQRRGRERGLPTAGRGLGTFVRLWAPWWCAFGEKPPGRPRPAPTRSALLVRPEAAGPGVPAHWQTGGLAPERTGTVAWPCLMAAWGLIRGELGRGPGGSDLHAADPARLGGSKFARFARPAPAFPRRRGEFLLVLERR